MPVLAYCICWTFMTILIAACVCRPFALNWNSKLKGHCGDRNAAYIAISALDIIGDALICVLPMPMIWRLRTSTSTKFGLSAVFTLGFL